MSENHKLKSDNEDFCNWETLYKNVLNYYNIKFISESRQTIAEIFESDLVINLNEFFAKQNNEIKANIIRIYGDVVQLSNNLEIQNLKCRGIILIAARRFEVKRGCQISIDYKEEKHFQLLIYAMEMPSELKIIKSKETDHLKFKINSPNLGGLISLHNGEFKNIPIFDSVILKKQSFIKLLRFSLQIAVALFYDNREITRSILIWIITISEQLKGKEEKEFEVAKKVYNYASRMLEQLNAFIEREESGFTLVPQLDMKSYKEHLNHLMKFAKDYENQYKDILKQEHIDKQKIEKLKDKLQETKDIAEVHEFLEEVEKKQFELSHNVREEIENKIQEGKNHAVNAYKELKKGIDDWLKDQKLAALKELFFAVLGLPLSIGKVFIQPGGVLNLVDTIKKVSNSLNNVLNNKEGIKDLINITNDEDIKKDIYLFKELNNRVNEIKKIKNELEASHNKAVNVCNSTEEINQKLKLFANTENLDKRLETDPEGHILNLHWEPIKNNINKLREFIKPIEQNIKGAEEYFNSSTEFISFIDTYIKAKIDGNKRSIELSRIQEQVEKDNRIKERLEQRIESKIKSQNDEIKLLLFEHLINIKYSMTLFMDKYRCAYEYRYLSKSNLKLSLIKEFNEDDINKMIKDIENVSNSRPQEKRPPAIEFKGEYVDKFKQNKSVKVDITPDNDKLNDYAHLRLHAFRVYLKGVGTTGELIKLYISHFNDFYDRDKENQIHQFKLKGEKKGFEYRVYEDYSPNKIDESYIELDNLYYDEKDKNYYFTPTPFSQWEISLKTTNTDLSALESINIHLVAYVSVI